MNKVQKVYAAWRHGIRIPLIAMRVSEETGVPFYVLCAFLEKESHGGANIFGHDPTIFVGAGKVTKSKYEAYKVQRKRTGQMQGVGPMQLTWYSFQDRADALGGCWKPYYNTLVGARILKAAKVSEGSWWAAAREYNGSPSYADAMVKLIDKWQARLA